MDNLKKINDERIKEIEKLKKENEDFKRTQGYPKQEIRDEVKIFVKN